MAKLPDGRDVPDHFVPFTSPAAKQKVAAVDWDAISNMYDTGDRAMAMPDATAVVVPKPKLAKLTKPRRRDFQA